MYPTKKLSEIFENIQYGFTGKTQESGKYRLLRITDIQDYSIAWEQVPFVDITDSEAEKYLLKKGDIVFARTGATVGKSCTINEDGEGQIFASYLIRVSGGNHKVNANYIQYFFQSENYWKQIYADVVGAAQPNFNGTKLKNLQIPLPPLSTQSRIVACLDSAFASIDEQISLLRANIRDVENMRKSVLEKSFQSGEYDNIYLGDKEYIEIIDGDRGVNYPKKTEFSDSGFCLFLNTSNVRQGFFDFAKMDFINEEKYNKMGKGKVFKNDVILTTRGTIGNSAFVENIFSYDYIRINSGMVILRNNLEKVSPKYLIHFINSPLFEGQKQKFTSGSAQPQLPITVIKKIFIPLPPLSRQHEIVAHLDEVFATTQALRAEYEAQIRDLDILKQSLLEEAFAGRLVSDE